jgi:hypothetical protein
MWMGLTSSACFNRFILYRKVKITAVGIPEYFAIDIQARSRPEKKRQAFDPFIIRHTKKLPDIVDRITPPVLPGRNSPGFLLP